MGNEELIAPAQLEGGEQDEGKMHQTLQRCTSEQDH